MLPQILTYALIGAAVGISPVVPYWARMTVACACTITVALVFA
jgi:hypothetical protein